MTANGSDFDKVTICSGHMIDAPDRETPRLPETKAEAVGVKIAEQLAQWEIGESDLAICGGACGADTLFAEECLRRGARLRLLLAQEADDFVRDSVRHAGEEWVRRFHALCEKAEVAILSGQSDRSLTTSRFMREPIYGSSIPPKRKPLILGRFTRCSSGTKNPLATGPAGPRISNKRSVILADRSQSSILPSCHDSVIRIFGAPARTTGRVAQQKSEAEQVALLHGRSCHAVWPVLRFRSSTFGR